MELDGIRTRIADASGSTWTGKVQAVVGFTLRVGLPGARLGDLVIVNRRGTPLLGEVVGLDAEFAVVVPFGEPLGVGVGDPVASTGSQFCVEVGDALLGRVMDGFGRPLDGGSALPESNLALHQVDRDPPSPLVRRPIRWAMATGVRAVDGLLTLGVGQRVGLFSGSGVGKSRLLAALARGTDADVVVVALVGERGREVKDFLARGLVPLNMSRTVVVASSSGAPAFERLKAAQVATTYAEYFRDQGASVLLLVDSLTRVARAQRDVGLAAGEPPTRRGYPPSVFSFLPRLLERTGMTEKGAISAVYTVLVEGGDLEEPVADEVRGILDGHWVLDRSLAARGHYPALDLGASLSRVLDQVVSKNHLEAATALRRLWTVYHEKKPLIPLGAAAPIHDPELRRALRIYPELQEFLCQATETPTAYGETRELLQSLAQRARDRVAAKTSET